MNIQTTSIENHDNVTKVDNSELADAAIPTSGSQCSPNPDNKTFETKAELGWEDVAGPSRRVEDARPGKSLESGELESAQPPQYLA
jgi:hypothetical protein